MANSHQATIELEQIPPVRHLDDEHDMPSLEPEEDYQVSSESDRQGLKIGKKEFKIFVRYSSCKPLNHF